MKYLTFLFLIRTISADVFLIKPLMEIDSSQRCSSAAAAEALLKAISPPEFLVLPRKDSTHSNTSQCSLRFRDHSRCEGEDLSLSRSLFFFGALIKDSTVPLFIGYSHSNMFVKRDRSLLLNRSEVRRLSISGWWKGDAWCYVANRAAGVELVSPWVSLCCLNCLHHRRAAELRRQRL